MPSINAFLTDEAHAALKNASAKTGIKLRFIIAQAIEEWIKNHLKGKKAA